MAGVSVDEGGKGGRRPLGSDRTLIPMNDRVMRPIARLLFAAVGAATGRLDARANAPGGPSAEGARP